MEECEKAVELYEWILNLFAEEGDVILDTHVGNAGSLIACHRTGHPFIGFEKDAYYYALSKERLEMEQAQMTMFDWEEERKQTGDGRDNPAPILPGLL